MQTAALRRLARYPNLQRLSASAARVPLVYTHPTQVRFAANEVGSKPGSQTFEHAKTNIKEELGRSAGDIAKSISGGNIPGVEGDPSFSEVTKAIAKTVPMPYMVVGLAGGLPYVGAAGTTIYTAIQAGSAASGAITSIDPGVAITLLHQALDFQVTYGAVMLSFLGAIHWGFEFAGYGGHKYYSRLSLGIAPLLVAWPTLAMDPMMALIAQWVGFTGLWWADLRATNAGWTPSWYSQYRFYLSILVGSCILASLAGTSYWGPIGGHGLVHHDLVEMRAEREKMRSERLKVDSDIETEEGEGKDANSFVVLKHKPAPKEKEDDESSDEESEGEDSKDKGDEKKDEGEEKKDEGDEKK